MERKGLPGTEAYPCGLLSVPGNSLQPMRLRGFKAKISRIQELFIFYSYSHQNPLFNALYVVYNLFIMIHRNQEAITALNRQGLTSAQELSAVLNISQPTVSRTLATLPKSRLHRTGKGRATRYGWRRDVAGKCAWPLYRLDEQGAAHLTATLYPLAGRTWHLDLEESWPSMMDPMFPNSLFPDWPWFLDDIRPGGFLGRLFARMTAQQLPVPRDPRDWSAEHTLLALSQFGADLPGAWILGEDMLAEATAPLPLQGGHPLTDKELRHRAESVLEGQWPGSSAAGEQPKFTLEHRQPDGSRQSLLVKFSGDLAQPPQKRWADLLRAEQLANQILDTAGILASKTRLHAADNRLFLISERFDRTSAGGRRAWVSLHALNAAFGDINRTWSASAEDFQQQGWLSKQSAHNISVLWWFGRLIGNTDMHDGNFSLFFTPELPLKPTPVYDMCPMALAPRADGTLPESLPPVPHPPPAQKQAFETARTLSQQFHDGILNDTSYSRNFREAFRMDRRPRSSN